MHTPLDRLRALVPPPQGGAATRDWAAVEHSLNLPLPQDYKDLVDTYGGGSFHEHIGLLVPRPTRVGSELVTYNDGRMDDLNNLWSIDDSRPSELAADDLRLIVWADTVDADSLNWRVLPGQPPERWPVVVLDADVENCELYSMTCVEFLTGLFSGEIDSEIISHQLAPEGPAFRPYPTTLV